MCPYVQCNYTSFMRIITTTGLNQAENFARQGLSLFQTPRSPTTIQRGTTTIAISHTGVPATPPSLRPNASFQQPQRRTVSLAALYQGLLYQGVIAPAGSNTISSTNDREAAPAASLLMWIDGVKWTKGRSERLRPPHRRGACSKGLRTLRNET